jgi:hypothetical protein
MTTRLTFLTDSPIVLARAASAKPRARKSLQDALAASVRLIARSLAASFVGALAPVGRLIAAGGVCAVTSFGMSGTLLSGGVLSTSLTRFRLEHGERWQIEAAPNADFADLVYGGGMSLGPRPQNDEQAITLARIALARTATLHRIEPTTLHAPRAQFLPLGQIGSTDKWTVRFEQRLAGVVVVGASVRVLIDADGQLLSVQSSAIPRVLAIDPSPKVTSSSAAERAIRAFKDRFGLEPLHAKAPELVVEPDGLAGRAEARLAWQTSSSRVLANDEPLAISVWIDAETGDVLRIVNDIHNGNVGGRFATMATPGLYPDMPGNVPEAFGLGYAEVTSAAGTTHADALGNFRFTGVPRSSLACTTRFRGLFNDVHNIGGRNYTQTATFFTFRWTVLLNVGHSPAVTAQANVYVTVNRMRDWIRSIIPTDATADRVFTSYVNILSTCNAYYFNDGLYFFAAGGECPNTAYSTIVAHEQGHWLNMVYGTDNGLDGMGEGNADVFAMYLYDTPDVGQDLYGPPKPLRTGLNMRQFCGDASSGCYGEVHDDGEVWMGAAWKIRANLNGALGQSVGDLTADTLFLSWMNSFDQPEIKSIMKIQWLLLDDDDANLFNLTPHFFPIENGFVTQGWPVWGESEPLPR